MQHKTLQNFQTLDIRQTGFADVSLCGVAGMEETISSLPVGGTFLPDVPGYRAHSDSESPSFTDIGHVSQP